MGRNLQREYGQDSQVAVIMPLLEGTDGVQKMSKSLGNYIGINEPPQEIFGKVMSISDDLMWRYWELCADLSASEIASLRESDRNPRDVKADLAKRIVADFYSEAEARKAEGDHRRQEAADGRAVRRDAEACRVAAQFVGDADPQPLRDDGASALDLSQE